MSLAHIMNTRLVTVTMDDNLGQVKNIFDNVRFHHLLVLESGQLIGILSDRDLFKALSPHLNTPSETPRDRATLNKKVHQIMTRHPITLRQENSVYDAVALFNRRMISCIPIVDDQQQPVGDQQRGLHAQRGQWRRDH